MKYRMLFAVLSLLMMSSLHAQQCDSPIGEKETRACVGNELRDSDRIINKIYSEVMASLNEPAKTKLRTEQRAWLKTRDNLCQLDSKIHDREVWIENILGDYSKTICVVHETRTRIAALKTMLNPTASSTPAPVQSQPDHQVGRAYDGKPSTIHTTGKWYFEFTLNQSEIAAIMPTVIVLGVAEEGHITGTMQIISGHNVGENSVRIGIAADLDNGKFYHSRNGVWMDGAPGSNQGGDLKTGRNYYAIFMVSASEQRQQMLDSGAFVPNFGDHPLAYAIPNGYSPWRNQHLQ